MRQFVVLFLEIVEGRHIEPASEAEVVNMLGIGMGQMGTVVC